MKQPVQTVDLDRAAAAVDRAAENAGFASLLARSPNPEHREEAANHAARAKDAAENALRLLLTLGATRPGGAVAVDNLPLHLLDTSASRRLLAVLEEAAAVALAVDKERGWTDGRGEGIGWAETLGGMALTLRREVVGPQGLE